MVNSTRIASLLQRAGWPIAIGALLCIQIAPLPLKLLGVLALLAVAWYRPDIALPLVPATAPLYLIPVALTASAGIPLHEIVLLLSVAGWAVMRWRTRQPIITLSNADLWPALLILSATASLLWVLPEGRSEALRSWRWIIVEPIIWFLVIRTAIQAQRLTTQALIRVLLGSGATVAGLGLLQFVGLDLVPWLGSKRAFSDNIVAVDNVRRVASVYGHPNNLGLFLERVWPFALLSVVVPAWRTRWSWPVLALCAIGLVLSFSRGAWLAAVLASALLVLVSQGAKLLRQKPWLMLVAVSAGLAVAAGALLARGTNVGSLDARVLFWHESLTWLQQRPWGLGLGQFYFYHNPEYGHSIIDPSLIGTSEQYAAHPHNLFLDLWLNLGPWGLMVVGVLVVRAWRQSILAPQASWAAITAGIVVVATVAHGLIDQFFFVSDLIYCFWLCLVLIAVDREPATRL